MRVRVRLHSAGVALTAWMLAGCQSEESVEAVCARLGGYEVGPTELVQLRAHMRPAPPESLTLALAVDVAQVQGARGLTLVPGTP